MEIKLAINAVLNLVLRIPPCGIASLHRWNKNRSRILRAWMQASEQSIEEKHFQGEFATKQINFLMIR